MKKLLLACTAAFAFAAINSANAADMALKAPPPPPPPAEWTGFYIGANGGYSWGHWDSSSLSAIFPGGFTDDPNVEGGFGGVQAGYNWQVTPQWVLGIEGDFDWSGEKASDGTTFSTSDPSGIFTGICDAHPVCTTTTTGTIADEWKLPWFATLRARAGFLLDPTWLLYGTGGVAFAGTKFSTSAVTTTTITNGVGTVYPGYPITASAAFSQSEDRTGFAVGGGIEKLLSQNLSLKVEYLFMDFGNYTFLSGTGYDTNVKLIDNIVRVGLDYHFGGGAGPVAAGY